MEKVAASLEKNQGVCCKISIDSYHPNLMGISESYRQAAFTSFVGERLDPLKTIYFFEDYKLPVFLAKANEQGIGEELVPYFHQLKENDKKGSDLVVISK